MGVLLGAAPFLRARPGVTAGAGNGGPKVGEGRSPGFSLEEQQQQEEKGKESSAARRAEDEEVGEDEEAEAEAPRSSGAEMERQVSRSSLQLGPQPCGSPARSVPGRGALGRSAASCPAQRSSRDEDPTADFLTSQEAATKIQAAFRGFCTRRQLRRAFSEPPRPAPGPQDSP
ncbi:sperm surface protein Sp17 isoform X1 [Lagopus muta]|uniref:sperm surface protein Sp17 isoform X1 n=1 Tax=Lagopus muta TaxID=64668 RepID=UPI00209D715A|nr:sperm surface protein Sp17 isoform X1 [Lagopus muta]